jgi:hypothetical protein
MFLALATEFELFETTGLIMEVLGHSFAGFKHCPLGIERLHVLLIISRIRQCLGL